MINTMRGVAASLLLAINTVLWCTILYAVAFLRWVTPFAPAKARLGHAQMRVVDRWVGCNLWMVRTLRLSEIEVALEGGELSRARWYLVVSNHQSWADIIVLQTVLVDVVPPLKFFTKQELIWVPFLGLAMKLLKFPYVKRYSSSQIAANPELRHRDRDATLLACRDFAERPTSVLNFLEGTRFTASKHAQQNSPFKHLLVPKPGGFGYVAEALGDKVHHVLDVTIVYPDGVPSFWDFLCGRCPRIHISIKPRGRPAVLDQNLATDDARLALREWVHQLWADKDQFIATKSH